MTGHAGAGPAALRPDRRHRGGDADPRRVGGHAGGVCRRSARAADATSWSASAGRWAASRFPARSPTIARGRRARPRLRGRGVQRAGRRRRLHVRLPARLAARTSRWRPAATTPMPAARSWSRAAAARRQCRPGRNCSISSSTASRIARCARTRSWTISTGRRPAPRPAAAATMMALAIDHRGQFEALAARSRRAPRRIDAFKVLAVRPRRASPPGGPASACCSTGRFGREALSGAADQPSGSRRPIESPGSRPLDVRRAAATSAAISPNGRCAGGQVPRASTTRTTRGPEAAARSAQLLRLFDACRKTRHELLVEIIAGSTARWTTTPWRACSQRLYDLGIRPDWWKLEPQAIAAAWAAHRRHDPGHDPYLPRRAAAGPRRADRGLWSRPSGRGAGMPMVKGFAVGRTIFDEPARRLAGGRDRRRRRRPRRWRAGFPPWSRPGRQARRADAASKTWPRREERA